MERDAGNNVKSVRVITDTTLYFKQTVTEIQKPDKAGNIKPVSRTTVAIDTFGGSTVIAESLLPGTTTWIATSITTTEKTADGLQTTVYARDKNGTMQAVSRTTSATKSNGTSIVL